MCVKIAGSVLSYEWGGAAVLLYACVISRRVHTGLSSGKIQLKLKVV